MYDLIVHDLNEKYKEICLLFPRKIIVFVKFYLFVHVRVCREYMFVKGVTLWEL